MMTAQCNLGTAACDPEILLDSHLKRCMRTLYVRRGRYRRRRTTAMCVCTVEKAGAQFRVCLIGCGSMSSSAHGPSLRLYANTHPCTELAGCCDLDAGKADEYRARFGFRRAYTDIDTMLADCCPHALVLIAPVELTCELSCKLLSTGLPLIMEKPPGLNPYQTRQMIAAAAASGSPTQVAFNRRYHPLMSRMVQELRALSDQGLPILSVQYEMLRVKRFDADFATTAVHAIDATRHIVGVAYATVALEHTRVSGEDGRGELQDATTSLLHCTFEGVRCQATINLSPVTGAQSERVTVCLRDHTFYLGGLGNDTEPLYPDGAELIHVSNGEVVARLSGRDPSVSVALGPPSSLDSGFYHEHENFLDTVRVGERPTGDLASGLQAVEVAECVRRRETLYQSKAPVATL